MNDGEGQQEHGLWVWARSQTPNLPQTKPEVRALQLEAGEYEGTAKHPFEVADREAYLASVKDKGIAKRTLTAPVGSMHLGSLKGIQRTVNRERLGQHMADPNLVREGSRASGHGGLVDLPVVVKLNGEFHIHDGHHRLTAAKLKGEERARVRFIDLDKTNNRQANG